MRSAATPKITIDTNCVVGLFDLKSQTATSRDELAELMRYALSGVVQLSVTTRVEVDFGRDKDAERRAEMMKHIQMLPVIGTVARWDVSKWDGGDVPADKKRKELVEEVRRIVFPGLRAESRRYANKIADIDHLVGHALSGRDVFVTDDGDILRRYPELKNAIGVVVMNPADCLRFVDAHYDRHHGKTLAPAGGDDAYQDRRLKGTVTFDYSNNDHRYTIGEGLFLFETRWSKASDVSIHAYRDSPSIDSVALVKDTGEISGIVDATSYDYSSRTRSPRVGQIVLWRNVNGLYAATKIIGIKDDTRGPDHDELTFSYMILSDGGTDFSRG